MDVFLTVYVFTFSLVVISDEIVVIAWHATGIILGMGFANERRRYIVMPSLVG